MAEIGKAGPGNEADIAGADHGNAHEVCNMVNGLAPAAIRRLLADTGHDDEIQTECIGQNFRPAIHVPEQANWPAPSFVDTLLSSGVRCQHARHTATSLTPLTETRRASRPKGVLRPDHLTLPGDFNGRIT